MSGIRCPRFAPVWLCAALVCAAPALAQNLVTVRLHSLDSVLADAEHLVGPRPGAPSREQMLGTILSLVGLQDASWIDRSRPISMVFPQTGLIYGGKGFVGALPVAAGASALDALAGRFEGHDVEEEQFHHFFTGEETELWAKPREGYLVVGASRSLVADFDMDAAMTIADAPPGHLQVELYLEPLTPMIQMGLMTARQIYEQQMVQAEDEPGNEAGSAPNPAAMKGILDIYFQLVADGLANTSRVQLALEVRPDDLLFHKRVLPRPGSTLAGLLAAQKGGLPDVARHIDPRAMVVATGQVTYTPAFRAALRQFHTGYLQALRDLGGSLAPSSQGLDLAGLFGVISRYAENLADCTRGDFATSWSFGAESGLRSVQLTGVGQGDPCKNLFAAAGDLLRALPPGPDGRPLVRVTEDALVHGGVRAMRQDFDLAAVMAESGGDGAAGTETANTTLRLIGDMTSYFGQREDLLLSVTGRDAEQEFKQLVDRVGANPSRREPLSPEAFSPLAVGPGVFASIDLRGVFRAVAALGSEEFPPALADLPEGTRRLVFGLRLDAGGLAADLALPLSVVHAIAAAASEDDPPEVPQEQAPDPADQGGKRIARPVRSGATLGLE